MQLSPRKLDFDASPSTTCSFPSTPVEISPLTPRGSSEAFFHSLSELGSPILPGHAHSPQNGMMAPLKTPLDPYFNDAAYAAMHAGLAHSHGFSPSAFHPFPYLDSISEVQSPISFPNPLPNEHHRSSSENWGQQFLADLVDWSKLSPPTEGGAMGSRGRDYDFPRAFPNDRMKSNGLNGISLISSPPPRQLHQPASSEVRIYPLFASHC